MASWVIFQRTTACNTQCEEFLFALVLGKIHSMFSFIVQVLQVLNSYFPLSSVNIHSKFWSFVKVLQGCYCSSFRCDLYLHVFQCQRRTNSVQVPSLLRLLLRWKHRHYPCLVLPHTLHNMVVYWPIYIHKHDDGKQTVLVSNISLKVRPACPLPALSHLHTRAPLHALLLSLVSSHRSSNNCQASFHHHHLTSSDESICISFSQTGKIHSAAPLVVLQ